MKARAIRLVSISAIAAIVIACLADFGFAISNEYRLSRAIWSSGRLSSQPSVSITGFPFTTEALHSRYRSITVYSARIPVAPGAVGNLEASLHDVSPLDGSHLISGSTPVHISDGEVRLRVDPTNLGRLLHIPDLTILTPPHPAPGAGSPADGVLKATHGLIFTGTVTVSGRPIRVSVCVDLSLVSASGATDEATNTAGVKDGSDTKAIRLTATDYYTGPELHSHARAQPQETRDVLAAFTRMLPTMPLPFGLTPTGVRSEGSNIVLYAPIHDLRTRLDAFVAQHASPPSPK